MSVELDGANNTVKTDTISEKTSANGVTIDGVNIKDSALVTAGSVPLSTIDIDGGTDIGAAIVDADLFIIDDGAGGTNRKTAASRLKTYVGGVVLSGSTNNNVATVTGANAIVGEANLNFDGTNLSIGTTTSAKKILVYEGSSGESAMEFQNTGTGVGAGNGIYVGLDANENGKIYNQEANGYLDFGTANTSRLKIEESGEVTMPHQPAFFTSANGGGGTSDIANNGNVFASTMTERFDKNADLSSTAVFTAPVTGTYLFTMSAYYISVDDTDKLHHFFSASNRNMYFQDKQQLNTLTGNDTILDTNGTCIVDMDANDTMIVKKGGGSTEARSQDPDYVWYGGYLVA